MSYLFSAIFTIVLSRVRSADFENQGANRLTKLHDPEGRRTVGVCHAVEISFTAQLLTITSRCANKT